jgi:hypothetical protein
MPEGEASRDVLSEFPGKANHVVNFDVILFLHPLPELPYCISDRTGSVYA